MPRKDAFADGVATAIPGIRVWPAAFGCRMGGVPVRDAHTAIADHMIPFVSLRF